MQMTSLFWDYFRLVDFKRATWSTSSVMISCTGRVMVRPLARSTQVRTCSLRPWINFSIRDLFQVCQVVTSSRKRTTSPIRILKEFWLLGERSAIVISIP
ncbi:hypothetical protein TNCV_2473191 [Trichonephila clavipes]|nr:hypothetical protein TNCV_2473191 [Trichonephila clavipes]